MHWTHIRLVGLPERQGIRTLPKFLTRHACCPAGTLPSWPDLTNTTAFVLPGNAGLCGKVRRLAALCAGNLRISGWMGRQLGRQGTAILQTEVGSLAAGATQLGVLLAVPTRCSNTLLCAHAGARIAKLHPIWHH